mgnify:FL=1
MEIFGLLLFIFGLLASVMVHEFGHYIFARKYGMRVSEFFVGFGKRIWSTQRGETEFGIKAIPAGGYCRIEGMTPTDVMPEGEADRAFIKASVPKKLVVLGAGSAGHFIVGYLLLAILLVGVGTTGALPTIKEIVPCVPDATYKCKTTDPVSPAKAAGLMAGDKVLKVDGKNVKRWGEEIAKVRKAPGKDVVLTIERDGAVQDLTVTPAARKYDGSTYGFIGIINDVGLVKSAPLQGAADAGRITWFMLTTSVKSLIQLPARIPALVRQTFGGEERDPEGPVGVVGVARVSGETAATAGLTFNERIATFLLIIASLNIFVGLFNLLPLLPLDGGHMAVAATDGVRNWIARLRGRAKPEPINVNKLMPVTVAVFSILIALTVLLLIADIVNPVHLIR